MARCQRGTARRRADSLVVPIRWALESTAASWSLEGDLAIAPISVSRSAVTFEATYTLRDEGIRSGLGTEQAVAGSVRVFLSCLGRALHMDDGW